MRYGGLFVGVDRQFDPEITELSYAGRDAELFWAAFADQNEHEGDGVPEDTALLVGVDATTQGVRNGLANLAARTQRHAYDLVVVHFSCHGTPDGRLILADAMKSSLETTALPISEITNHLPRIPARATVIVFESCFSGAALSGDPEEEDAPLRAIMKTLASDGNRAVVWAAGPGQRAWETPRLKHGVLTYSLVQEGLYGTHALDQDERISIGRWLSHATGSARRHAELEHRLQSPGLVLRIDEGPRLPRFSPGPRRRNQLRDAEITEVLPDLGGLDAYGLTAPLVDAVRRRIGGGTLTELQRRAIYPTGALAGQSVLVAGPTSSGKTLVAELAALTAARRRLKTLFLVPMRALASEKWKDFQSAYGPAGVRCVRSYGGTGDDDDLIHYGHYDLAFLTYEKFLLLALAQPTLLDGVGLVVVDEVHMISDDHRGHVVELLLSLLRARAAKERPVQILALSAALGDLRGFPDWLEAKLVQDDERPIPLLEGVMGPSGSHRRLHSATKEESQATYLRTRVALDPNERDPTGRKAREKIAAELIVSLVQNGKQVLVFRSGRSAARRFAKYLATRLALDSSAAALSRLPPLTAADPSRTDEELRTLLGRGVAYHISDLDRDARDAVEDAFRAGELRLLVATSGLAMGVNLPADAVVIADHARGGLDAKPFTVAEYKNMAGRAGRWVGSVTEGSSFLIAQSESEVGALWDEYVIAEPEPVESRLARLRAADYALALLALDREAPTLFQLLGRANATFAGWLARLNDGTRRTMESQLEAAIQQLEFDGFVTVGQDDRLRPTAFGSICGREGILVAGARRVLRAATELSNTGTVLDSLTLIALCQLTEELDATYTPIEDPGPLSANEQAAWRNAVSEPIRTVLATDASPEDLLKRTKRTATISMWVRGVSMKKIETAFLRAGPSWMREAEEPVAGPIRASAERTADVIRAVTNLLRHRLPENAARLREQALQLLPRLQDGVGKEASALVRMGIGLSRHAALQLIDAGLGTPASVVDAAERGDERLYAIFGSEGVFHIQSRIKKSATQGRETPTQGSLARAAIQEDLLDLLGDVELLD